MPRTKKYKDLSRDDFALISKLKLGMSIAASNCSVGVFREALKRGILVKEKEKGGKSFARCLHWRELDTLVCEWTGCGTIQEAEKLSLRKAEQGFVSRSDLAELSQGTKTRKTAVASGLIVNCIGHMHLAYEGKRLDLFETYDMPHLILHPEALFVDGYDHICIAENYEVVARVRDYKMEDEDRKFGDALFVARPTDSRKLIERFLANNKTRPITYMGDFDWSGLRVYLSEYKSRYGDRCRFFVPRAIERYFELPRSGNHALLVGQKPVSFDELAVEEGLMKIGGLIGQYQKGIEQEELPSLIKMIGHGIG